MRRHIGLIPDTENTRRPHQSEFAVQELRRTGRKISAAELAQRVAIERRHDGGADLAHPLDLDAERDARAKLCPCCGEPIADKPSKCPVCHSVFPKSA